MDEDDEDDKRHAGPAGTPRAQIELTCAQRVLHPQSSTIFSNSAQHFGFSLVLTFNLLWTQARKPWPAIEAHLCDRFGHLSPVGLPPSSTI